MSGLACVFPGQGSQEVGMGKELWERYPVAREVFATADEVLGFSLTRLCFQGPAEELQLTVNAQPALLTVACAAWAVVRRGGLRPQALAGHSLGEYSALVAAGALDLAEAVRLVRRRGELMEAAVPAGQGTMAAVLGLDGAAVEALCREVAAGGLVVEPATYNGPGQVVVAGHTAAVDELVERARQAGARRAVRLAVSGPFHCSLLEGAGAALEEELDRVTVRDPQIPVVANVTADFVRSAAQVRRCLVEQVRQPVRWEESVRRLWQAGMRSFAELGPGRVLSGLIRRIVPEASVQPAGDRAGLEKLLAERKGDVVR